MGPAEPRTNPPPHGCWACRPHTSLLPTGCTASTQLSLHLSDPPPAHSCCPPGRGCCPPGRGCLFSRILHPTCHPATPPVRLLSAFWCSSVYYCRLSPHPTTAHQNAARKPGRAPRNWQRTEGPHCGSLARFMFLCHLPQEPLTAQEPLSPQEPLPSPNRGLQAPRPPDPSSTWDVAGPSLQLASVE